MTMRSSAVIAVTTGRGSSTGAPAGGETFSMAPPAAPSPASVATSMMLSSRGISASSGANASAGWPSLASASASSR